LVTFSSTSAHLDEVAEARDELGLHQVHHVHGRREDTRPSTAGVVDTDREPEVIGVVLEVEVRVGLESLCDAGKFP
jgi:hypothetical protein